MIKRLRKGMRATILNSTLSGETIVEGNATLVKRAAPSVADDLSERWAVRFDGDEPGVTFERNVFKSHIIKGK